jgi:hypothetical protein
MTAPALTAELNAPLDPVSRATRAIQDRLKRRFGADWQHLVGAVPFNAAEWAKIAGMTPFVLVGFRSLTGAGTTVVVGAATFQIVVGVRNPSGWDARFHGDGRGAGLFPALCVAAALLGGHQVAGLGGMTVTEVATEFAEGMSDAAVAFGSLTVTMPLSLADTVSETGAPPDFQGFAPFPAPPGGTVPPIIDLSPEATP